MVLMPKIVFPALRIQEGGKQEMLAVPLQQSALLVKQHENDISIQDLEAIYKILGDDVAEPIPMVGVGQCERLFLGLSE